MCPDSVYSHSMQLLSALSLSLSLSQNSAVTAVDKLLLLWLCCLPGKMLPKAVTALLVAIYLSEPVIGVTIPQGIIYKSANVSRDGQTLLLGALFPIHQTGVTQPPCGTVRTSAVQTVEAMVLAIQTINNDPNLLPNLTLAFDIRDTCLSVNYALQQSADYITTIGSCDNEQESSLGVSTVLGAFQSTISEAIANLYGLFEIPQISYGSSAAVLSDTNRYNFFFRTIPSDLFQARALVDIVLNFGWRYIIVLHSDDLYGVGGRDAFRDELEGRNLSVSCIAAEIELRDSPPNYEEAVDEMNQDWVKNASVVLLFGHMENAVGVLGTIRERVTEDPLFPLQNLTWLASDSWGDNLPPEYHPLARGMLSTVPQFSSIQAFDDYFTALDPRNNTENPWFDEYWESVFNCNLGLSPDLPDCDVDNQTLTMSSYSQFSLVPLVVDAVYAFAHGVQSLIDTKCPNGDLCSDILIDGTINGSLLRDRLQKVTFPSLSRSSVEFDENGDVAGNYSILNLQEESDGQFVFNRVGAWDVRRGLEISERDIEWVSGDGSTPESICSQPCNTGEIRLSVFNQPSCCFTCTECPRTSGIIIEDTTCELCELGKSPDANQTTCINNTIIFLEWDNPWSIVLITLTCIGVVLTLVVGVILLVHIQHEFIKASSRELSAILLGGILFCYVVPFFYIAQPSPAICGLRRLLLGLSFTIMYAALLVKTNRIHRIFNRSSKMSTKQLRLINPASQVLFTAILVSVQVVISVIWLAVEPPDTQEILGRETNELTCAFSPQVGISVSLIYPSMLLLFSTYFAFLTRKVPANFNEAKFINATVYSIIIIWLAFIPTYFATADLGTIFQTVTLVFGVVMSATTTLLCLFFSKVFILFRKKKKEETQRTQQQNSNTVDMINTQLESSYNGKINTISTNSQIESSYSGKKL